MKYLNKDTILKGQLRNYSLYIADLMLQEQVLAGNKLDITVFENDIYAAMRGGGFNWNGGRVVRNWSRVIEFNEEPILITETLVRIEDDKDYSYHNEKIESLEVVGEFFAKIKVGDRTILTHNIKQM